MRHKSHNTTVRAALLLVAAAVLSGGMRLSGVEGLEGAVVKLRARVNTTLIRYRERIGDYKVYIAQKIRAGEYGRGAADTAGPKSPAPVIGHDERPPALSPVESPPPHPHFDGPPPKSPLVRIRTPIASLGRGSVQIVDRVPGNGFPAVGAPRSTRPRLERAAMTPTVSPASWTNGSRRRPRVALSFDSGEMSAGMTGCERLIDQLVKSETPATFFLTGRFTEGYPDIVRRISSVAHFELGNHSHSHPDLTKKPEKVVEEEILRAQRAIYRISGRRGRLFRPPYGKTSSTVNDVAARYGLHTVLWDVAADDYRKDVSGAQVAKSVLAGAQNGSIVLLHMHGDGSAACEALPEIIAGLRGRGFELVKVSTLIDDARTE